MDRARVPVTVLTGVLGAGRRRGYDTLATRVWATTSQGFFGRAAAPALDLIVVSSVPLAFLALRDER